MRRHLTQFSLPASPLVSKNASRRTHALVEAWLFDKVDIDLMLMDYPSIRMVLTKLSLKRSEQTLEKMMETDELADLDES